MRLVFMGTPDFAVAILRAVVEAGHEVACVYAQPPRPAGRGKQDRPNPTHVFADAHGIPVRTPKSLRTPEAQAEFAALGAEVAVVAAYGLILPKPILAAPTRGCLNVHGSLLPRWRGAAPIQRAIMAGDAETGITIMQMDEGLDTGAMLLKRALPIGADETAGSLHDRLAELGAVMMVEALARLESLVAEPQPEPGVTYAAKIAKDEARIDWTLPAAELHNHIRGLSPFPGAWFEHGGERFKVLETRLAEGAGTPGETLDERLTVACGEGALRLAVVQRAGKAPMPAEALLRGYPLPAGSRL
jgi:methionyl-tRNA formyltransferase